MKAIVCSALSEYTLRVETEVTLVGFDKTVLFRKFSQAGYAEMNSFPFPRTL
jgi:hypothetical protein